MKLNDCTFLYVEDDQLSREIMQMMMENVIAARLTVFPNSSDFLARLQAVSPKPDVIMLDIHILPHDGFELLRQIRADAEYATSRVIALTASVMNEEVDRLRTSGFDGAIAKPLNLATFPGLIERVLAGEAVWHIA